MTIYSNQICRFCIVNKFRISSNKINLADVYTVDTLVIGDMRESYCIPICCYILYESQIQSNDSSKLNFLSCWIPSSLIWFIRSSHTNCRKIKTLNLVVILSGKIIETNSLICFKNQSWIRIPDQVGNILETGWRRNTKVGNKSDLTKSERVGSKSF